MDYSPPVSSVHGIFQARILVWVAIFFSKGSSQPRDWTWVSCSSCISRWILYHCVTREAQMKCRWQNKTKWKKKKKKPTTTSSNPKNGPWSNSSQLLFSCSDPLRISECHLPPLPASDLFIQLSCNSLTSPLDTALLLALLVPSDLAEQLGLQLAVAKKVNLWNRREREGWSWPSRLMEQRTWILPSVSFSNSLSDPLWCPAHFLRSASFTWLKIGHQPLP